MSARLLLNVVHTMLVEAHGLEKVDELLNPPSAEEKRAEHFAQLRALGIPIEVS